MELIKVTEKSRNNVELASPAEMLIDVCDISRPLVENSSSETIMYLQESVLDSRQAEPNNSVQYVLTEDMATVVDKSANMFIGTVVMRNDRAPIPGAVLLGFSADKIVGAIRKYGDTTNSIFYYQEEGDIIPVKYVVSETIAQIEAKLILT